MPEPKPLVTIAISSREDEGRIEACLAQARAQSYPDDRIEILVADAMSMDATREVVLRAAAEDPRVRLLENPERTRASALNAIVRAAKGEIVVPMDPGGEYGKTHVQKCVDALSTSPAEHLAIVPRTAGRTLVERALSAVQQTNLAFASSLELAADHAPAIIGAVRRRVFDKIGLYDPGARVEEDEELAHRIEKNGGAVTVRRDIVVHRAEASSFKELFRRHYLLGRSRARTTVKDKKIRSLRTLAPFAIVVGGGALAATSSVQPVTPFAAGLYALVTGAAAIRVGRSEGLVTIPIAWAAYPVMHVAHGIGFGAGIVRAIAKPDWGVVMRLDEAPEG
jgi:succinoglycan biosynthesis protein ExoA